MTEETKPVMKKKAAPKKVAKIVKMVNEQGKEADVHPDEVENFKKGGFREAK